MEIASWVLPTARVGSWIDFEDLTNPVKCVVSATQHSIGGVQRGDVVKRSVRLPVALVACLPFSQQP